MTAALHAEWTKLRTLRETWWLAAGVILVALAASAAMVATTHVSPAGSGGAHDPTKLALTGLDLAQAVVAVLGVLTVTDEYGTGMVRVTFAAVPRREAVLGAKALVITAVAVVAAVVSVAGCLVIGRLLLPGAGLDPAHGYPLVSVDDGSGLRAALGAVIYLVLVALLSLGVGALVRDTAVATGTVLGLLYLPPLLALVVAEPLRRDIERFAPMTAGLAIEATRGLRGLAEAPWVGLGVLAGWATGALVVGGAVLRARDA